MLGGVFLSAPRSIMSYFVPKPTLAPLTFAANSASPLDSAITVCVLTALFERCRPWKTSTLDVLLRSIRSPPIPESA
eukprot:3417579-Prorocentrum_lima.AAC.1